MTTPPPPPNVSPTSPVSVTSADAALAWAGLREYGATSAATPPATFNHLPDVPPNSPVRRARSVSVTAGLLGAAATRTGRLPDAVHHDPSSILGDSPPSGHDDEEDLEYPPLPAAFEFPTIQATPAAPATAAEPVRGERPRAQPAPPLFAVPTTPLRTGDEPEVQTAPPERTRKRLRLSSPSPTRQPTLVRASAGPLRRTALSLRTHLNSHNSCLLSPADWRVRPGLAGPSSPPGVMGSFSVSVPPASLTPLPAMTAPLRGRSATPMPSASPAARPLHGENAAPVAGPPGMELDLPITYPSPFTRTASEIGQPLEVLDINRNRFPTAIGPAGPLQPHVVNALWPGAAPPVASGTAGLPGNSAGDAWGRVPWSARAADNAVTNGVRPPTPYPAGLGTAPPYVTAQYSSSTLSRLGAAMPLMTGGVTTTGTSTGSNAVVGTATYTAASQSALAALPIGPSFTPTPEGGFPEVVFGQPYGILAGLPRARLAGLEDPTTGPAVAVGVWNSGFPAPRDLRPMTGAITETVQAVTGELDILLVPPEVEWSVPKERRVDAPLAWIVLGLSREAVARLVELRVRSSASITLFFYRPAATIPRFLFLTGGFAHDRDNSVMHAIWNVFSGPRVLPGILLLAQTNPAFVGARHEDVARAILGSLEVRVTTLRNGNIVAAVFCDSPTQSVARWREWRDSVAALPFPSSFNSTGFARRPLRCAGCHGADHPTYLCPFQDIPGWHAPPPGMHWTHAGPPPPEAVTGQPPPGPLPPLLPPPSRTRGPTTRGGDLAHRGTTRRDRRDRPGNSGFAMSAGGGPTDAPLY